jgi:hypothetical protein
MVTPAERDPTVQKLAAAKLKLSGAANSQLKKLGKFTVLWVQCNQDIKPQSAFNGS